MTQSSTNSSDATVSRVLSGKPGAEEGFLLAAIQKGLRGERYSEDSLPSGIAELDWERVVELAFEHRVASLLSHTLAPAFKNSAIPRKQASILKGFFLETTQKNLRIRHSLNRIIAELAKRGIEVIVLKGADLAFTIWPHMATRQMQDIDIVVPINRVEESLEVLLELGYEKTRDLSLEWHLTQTKEISALVDPKSGIEVEIHFRFFTPNPRIKIDETPFWDHAKTKDFGGVPAKVLGPEELFILLCLHVTVGHFLGDNMRSLLDIKLLMEAGAEPLDAPTIESYLSDPHVGPLVAFPVMVCSKFLEVDFAPVIKDADSLLSRYYSGAPLAVLEKCADHFLFKTEPETLGDRVLIRLATAAIYDSTIGNFGLIQGFFAEQEEVIRDRNHEKVGRLTATKNLIQRRTKYVLNLIRSKE